MKSTGMIRRIDQLGRIVIPIEIRKTLKLKEKDGMEIFIDGDHLIFKKYAAHGACLITGEVLDSNIEFAPGLILSPTGVETLFNKLKKVSGDNL